MGRITNKLRVLLIQIRDHQPAERQEQDCVLRCAGLRPRQLHCHNLLREPNITLADLKGADTVLIGGAGSHSVTRDYPFTRPLSELTQELVERRLPLFGSCYGHQVLAVALGGRVVEDLENEEIGTFDIELTPEGLDDPLLAGLPARLPVQLGHHDQIAILPEGALTLASSERCSHQLIRLKDRPVYSSQFHCELGRQSMIERLEMYRDVYLQDDQEWNRFHASLRETKATESLFARFLDLYT